MNVKLSYIAGLKPVVLKELEHLNFQVLKEVGDSVYVPLSLAPLSEVKLLRSVTRAYVVLQNDKYHPAYISNHKSILGELIDVVTHDNEKEFRSFKINCAGLDSPEVRSISRYISETYNMEEREEADLKIHIIKTESTWEVGAQITPRPLSMRDYRVANISGAMDPTIAYAVNSLCNLETSSYYLNIFSGSGTLLIEAGQVFPNLEKLVGFDNNKKHLSLSIQNIKKAGLVKKVQIKEASLFDKPDFGKFDTITSDLPFGMRVSKGEDLGRLYRAFVEYSEEKLNPKGRLVVYTSEFELLEPILLRSNFRIIQSLPLKLLTNANTYLKAKIIVCEQKD